jgi:hypothetical protein
MKKDKRIDGPPDRQQESQLDEMLAQLSVEKAPASLTRRLKRIPRDERPESSPWSWLTSPGLAPRWVMAPALAVVSLLVISVVLMQPQQPSPDEVEQARRQLAVAFAYLDKAGSRTGAEIQSVLDSGLQRPVKENLSKHIPYTKQSLEEEAI